MPSRVFDHQMNGRANVQDGISKGFQTLITEICTNARESESLDKKIVWDQWKASVQTKTLGTIDISDLVA